jgi:hypothetical protein
MMFRMLVSVSPNRFIRISSLRKLLLTAIVIAVPANARAMVTEPNGQTAPNPVSAQEILDSGNKELHLDALFTSRGETINFVTDGITKPAVFSPTCSFNGEMVLRGGGCNLTFGWYNAVAGSTTPPTDAQIYPLIPATPQPMPFTPAVGDVIPATLMFTADNIRADPNYKGGLIGFAIRKEPGINSAPCTQTHYSEQQLNGKCTDCKPVSSWVTAVIWKSTKTTDSYYIGFEDLPFGTTAATGLASIDGDFNDFVYYVSGVSCDGGGAPCDTGMPGICKDGLKECVTGGQLVCKPNLKPSTEVCDGLDNDCDGMTDNMAAGGPALCPGKFVCDRGVCVPPCSMTEFPCSPGYMCVRSVCVENACADKVCPDGQICKAGVCKGKCDGVTCPLTQVCRVGRCVDPCAGIKCASDRVCAGGVCVPSCKCRTCDAPKACQTATGSCVDKGCEAMTCNAGEVCQGGTCVDACMGAVCPVGQECKMGACADIPKPDGGVVPTGGSGGGGDTGSTGGAGGDTSAGTGGGGSGGGGAGGATSVDAGQDAPPVVVTHAPITASNGCRCDAGGANGTNGTTSGGLAAFGFALAAFVSTRRRRRAR